MYFSVFCSLMKYLFIVSLLFYCLYVDIFNFVVVVNKSIPCQLCCSDCVSMKDVFPRRPCFHEGRVSMFSCFHKGRVTTSKLTLLVPIFFWSVYSKNCFRIDTKLPICKAQIWHLFHYSGNLSYYIRIAVGNAF